MTWWKYLPQRNLQRVSKRHPLSSESLLTSPPMFAWHWLFWLILVPHIPLLIWCLSKTLFPSRTFSYHSWCFFPWGCKIGLLDILIKKILLMDSNILMYGLSVLSRNVLEHIFIFNSQRRFESMRERERALFISPSRQLVISPTLGVTAFTLCLTFFFCSLREDTGPFYWGRWWELGREPCFKLEKGSKGKGDSLQCGFISFDIVKGHILSSFLTS